ncbi:MAG: hypothetical protein ABW252_21320 [Polyangiales bacterium]
MSGRSFMLFVGALWVGAGCSVARVPPAEREPEAPSTPAVVAEPVLDPALMQLPLGERLAREAEARPARAVRAAQMIEALRARGVQAGAQKQVLASPVAAAYCEVTRSPAGLGLSVCEYPDAASLDRGVARSHALFDRLLPGRTLLARENTLLTITRAESEPAARELALARAAFAALAPSARVP